MVKLQRSDAEVVAAVFAPAASDFDETLLTLNPPPSLTAIRRFVPPLSPIGIRQRPSDRALGRVMSPKRRARETELPSVEGSQFSVNDLLRRELAAALSTDQRSRRASRIEPRTAPRLEWQTIEALAPPMQVATLAVDDRVVTEK